MHSFDKANNFVIHTLNQTENRAVDANGFKRLQDYMVPGAAHDAGERFDAPKCHPETRKAVLSSIKSWVDSTNEAKRVTWLHGPAGAGKSAIAQTTAEDCHEENKLAAAFFFSRLAGRNKKHGLVATIAYQLCVSIPATKEHIIKNIEKNPNIFRSNLKAQFQSLVIEPINQIYQTEGEAISPKIIIIDGLDECDFGKDQAEIIEAVFHALSLEHGSQIRVLLASRPELEIRQAFNSMDVISPFYNRLSLDNTFDPDADIELYLRSSFQTIKRLHTLGSTLPESWPSNDDINQIVNRSSGQFIYASTVISFVSDIKRDPRKRLDIILEIKPDNGQKPFAQMDALYLSILSVCEDYGNVASIFEAIMFLNSNHVPVDRVQILLSPQYLNCFLSLEDDVLLYLANLHSIVNIEEDTLIQFHHASFYDFLVDSSRSNEFYIDKHKAHARLFFRCFDFLESNVSSGLPNIVYAYCMGCCFCHFRFSNWDDSILEFICKNNVLKPGNGQMKTIFKTFYAQPHTGGARYTSMLGHLIKILREDHEDNGELSMNARRVAVEEVFNHLKQYPEWTDVILLLYVRDTYSVVDYDTEEYNDPAFNFLHRDITTAVEEGNNDIVIHDIMYNQTVNFWFCDLMKNTAYIKQLVPEDVPSEVMSRMLEIIANELESDLNTYRMDNLIELFSDVAKYMNIPTAIIPNEPVPPLILEKWEIYKKEHHLYGEMGIDKFFQNYCKPSTTVEDNKVFSSGDTIEISLQSNTELAGACERSVLKNVTQPNETQDASISKNVGSSKLSYILGNVDTTIVQGDTTIETGDADEDETNSPDETQKVNNNFGEESQISKSSTGDPRGSVKSPDGLLAQRNIITFLRLLWNSIMYYWSGSY